MNRKAKVTEKYHELLKSKEYEAFVSNIIKKSQYCFDKDEDYRIELLFYLDQFYRSLNIDNIEEYINQMQTGIDELDGLILRKETEAIEQNQIYLSILNQIIDITSDELNDNKNIILFVPFIFTSDIDRMSPGIYRNNALFNIFSYIIKNNYDKVEGFNFILINPNVHNELVIRKINISEIEFVGENDLDQYISCERKSKTL